MTNALNDALRAIALFVPKLLAFIVILIIGLIVAKLIGKAIDAVLEKVGFDKAVERGGIKKALAKSEYDASAIVGKLVYYTLMLFVLQLAFGVFGPNPISDLLAGIIAFLPKAIVAIILIVIAAAIATAVRELISNSLGGLSYGKTLANIAGVFILGLGIIAALNQVGIATTVTTPILIAVLTAVVGVIVVGVGGGLVKPMQARWEDYLTKAEAEAPKLKQEAANAPSVKEQARQAKDKANAHLSDDERDYDTTPQGGSAPTSEVYDQGATQSYSIDDLPDSDRRGQQY